MSFFSNLIVPLVLCMVFLGALVQRVDLLSAFAKGVREGLQVVLDMFPSLMLLTLAVSVFQSSGALELLSRALSAPASLLGLPEPIIPLYCSAAGIKKSRYAAPASLCADLMGFVASAAAVRWLMG